MTDKVLLEERGAVRILTINRPEQRNCVDGETAAGIGRAIEAFAADPGARVLVVTGQGDAAFCSGADLKNPVSCFRHEYVDRAGPMGFARLDPGKPTIAAINGYCFAGGGELAAWCDIRIGAENAEFGCLSRRWGVPYTDGGTQRFPRLVGTGNALYMLLTGVRFNARRAYEMGFLQELVPRGQALPRALELAEAIAAYPNFPGICADRRALLSGLSLELDEALLLEARVVRPACYSQDGGIAPELAQGLARFAGGARDASPRPPS
ncbi:MAG: enoyl-CoA hydratase-related protein [Candidatus Eremiobacterota bacterium]